MRSNLEGATIRDCVLLRGNRLGHSLIPSTGTTIVLDGNCTDLVELKLTAATGVRLPLASANRGRQITFLNSSSGAFAATLKTSTGGALPTSGVIQKGKMRATWSNGVLWYTDGNPST